MAKFQKKSDFSNATKADPKEVLLVSWKRVIRGNKIQQIDLTLPA